MKDLAPFELDRQYLASLAQTLPRDSSPFIIASPAEAEKTSANIQRTNEQALCFGPGGINEVFMHHHLGLMGYIKAVHDPNSGVEGTITTIGISEDGQMFRAMFPRSYELRGVKVNAMADVRYVETPEFSTSDGVRLPLIQQADIEINNELGDEIAKLQYGNDDKSPFVSLRWKQPLVRTDEEMPISPVDRKTLDSVYRPTDSLVYDPSDPSNVLGLYITNFFHGKYPRVSPYHFKGSSNVLEPISIESTLVFRLSTPPQIDAEQTCHYATEEVEEDKRIIFERTKTGQRSAQVSFRLHVNHVPGTIIQELDSDTSLETVGLWNLVPKTMPESQDLPALLANIFDLYPFEKNVNSSLMF